MSADQIMTTKEDIKLATASKCLTGMKSEQSLVGAVATEAASEVKAALGITPNIAPLLKKLKPSGP